MEIGSILSFYEITVHENYISGRCREYFALYIDSIS